MSSEALTPASYISPAQRLLDDGKYLITQMDGSWHMILPSTSWLADLLNDCIFRAGFDSNTPEATVREFYMEKLNVDSSEIVTAPEGSMINHADSGTEAARGCRECEAFETHKFNCPLLKTAISPVLDSERVQGSQQSSPLPSEPQPSAERCFKCGEPTSGRLCRLNDNLEIDSDLPMRPVCNACGPKWNIVEQMGRNTYKVTASAPAPPDQVPSEPSGHPQHEPGCAKWAHAPGRRS